jgi:molybdenum cofactor cytidylyltransferase
VGSDQQRSGIAAVILAAGASSRMGSPKQLLVHDGQPLVRRAALAARNAGVGHIIVVLGSSSAAIEHSLGDTEWMSIVVNHDWRSGQSTSLRAGLLEAERARADGVLVMLADQPLVDSNAIGRLLSKFDSEHRIVASVYAGTVGVPAVFGFEHLNELMTITGDTGAGKWLRARAGRIALVPLPEAVVDIDTPEDAEALAKKSSHRPSS